MGKAVEKKKKKGRPSLLDLQKRSLREEQSHSHGSDDNSAPNQPQKKNHRTPVVITQQRRSTRRNPASSSPDEREEGESSLERRREKKLKLVLRAPNSGGSGAEEDAGEAQNHRKRKIAAIGDGSGGGVGGEKEEKPANPASTQQGSQLDSEASTPLPDKKLLLFILERLQKKDTYGVFSEPVDPEELPDYHDIIEHPMDFGTLRKKLDGGAYTSLDQIENDVFLICSNAMQYNAPDTVYFRQARSIQELARKNFSSLRQESDGNEPEPKVVRRGRPPTKHLKRPPGRPPLDRTGASDATLATGGENTMSANFNMRKGPFSADKLGLMRNNNVYSLMENRFERNGDYAGSSSKGNLMKFGKQQPVPEENRRNTYKHPSSSGREPFLLATFDQGRKQLMAVALQADHGYARSLARFTSDLGPAAWKVASRIIERSLPAGTKFGPGWIGEDFLPPRRFLLSSPAPSSLWPFSLPGSSCSKGTDHSVLERKDNSAENLEGEHLNRLERQPTSVISSEPLPPPPQPITKETEAAEGSKLIKPPSKIHSNGFTGPFGYSNNLTAAHMGKMMGDKHSSGYHFRPPVSPEAEPTAYTNSLHPEDPHTSRNNSAPGRSPLSQQKPELGLPHQRRPGSAPPDLNIRFHSPGSPTSTRADSAQPDLALQL